MRFKRFASGVAVHFLHFGQISFTAATTAEKPQGIKEKTKQRKSVNSALSFVCIRFCILPLQKSVFLYYIGCKEKRRERNDVDL